MTEMTDTPAAALRALHRPGEPLVLPNVWDAESARAVEGAGFPVVATSSAAVAESLGYADHQQAPAVEMLAAAARIARAVSVPVTVDAEAGYGLPAAEFTARLAEAGVAGCNLEDTDHERGGVRDLAEQAEWLAAVRAEAGDALVINARIDVFIRLGTEDAEREALPTATERARAYLDAGADCVYPILIGSPGVLAEFVGAVAPAAVNALYRPGSPDVARLAKLGVARISFGPGLWRLAQERLTGDLAALAGGRMLY